MIRNIFFVLVGAVLLGIMLGLPFLTHSHWYPDRDIMLNAFSLASLSGFALLVMLIHTRGWRTTIVLLLLAAFSDELWLHFVVHTHPSLLGTFLSSLIFVVGIWFFLRGFWPSKLSLKSP